MKKVLMFFGCLVVVAVVVVIIVSLTSKKLVCKSDQGDITIMYNNKTLKGYTAKGMTYNLKEQQEYAEQIGVEAYLDEFTTWFETNTTGTCKR